MLMSRYSKALNLPRSDGTAPAHAAKALNKNIRLDLKNISQRATIVCVAGEYNVKATKLPTMSDAKATLNYFLLRSLPTKFALTNLIKRRDIDVAHTKHTRTSCEVPKAKIITKTNSGVSRCRHNNENARCCKTMVVSNHARCHPS